MPTTTDATCTFTEFDETRLRAATLTNCTVKKAVGFHEADLSGATVYGTSLKGIDLSTCRITNLGATLESRELKGAKLDMLQLTELAGMLGIEIV